MTTTNTVLQGSDWKAQIAGATSDIRNPRLLAFCLALIPTVSGTKRGLLVPGLRLSEVLAIAVLGLLLMNLHRHFRVGGAVFWGLLAYSAVTAVVVALHWFNSSDLGPRDFIAYGLGPIVLLLTFTVSYAAGAACGELLLNVCRYLILLAAIMGGLAFLQIAGVAGSRKLASVLTGNQTILNMPNWKVPRGIGIFHSWHAYASYMALTLIVAIALLAYGVRLYNRAFVFPTCMALVGIGLISSLTFGMALLGLGGAAYFLLRKGKWAVATLGAVLILVVSQTSFVSDILSERVNRQSQITNEYGFLPQTVAFRVAIWTREFIPLVADNPLTGHGPIRASDRVFQYAESMYILVLVTTGVIGVISFLVFVVLLIGSLVRRTRSVHISDPVTSAVVEAVLLFIIGLLVLMFIHPYLNDAGSSELLVVLVGIVLGSRHLIGDHRTSQRSEDSDRGVPVVGKAGA
ncbi:O-antigen ligase family protein [Rhodococcus rhodochrous]|uniref:O-antigen ligase family protein n=1 Tax=Rhodococcus rhodochrous TaxID=1829 RepID=UPI0012FD156E|nr:O-antigen ligase family protein [Rhodococcus rhodochrous]